MFKKTSCLALRAGYLNKYVLKYHHVDLVMVIIGAENSFCTFYMILSDCSKHFRLILFLQKISAIGLLF